MNPPKTANTRLKFVRARVGILINVCRKSGSLTIQAEHLNIGVVEVALRGAKRKVIKPNLDGNIKFFRPQIFLVLLIFLGFLLFNSLVTCPQPKNSEKSDRTDGNVVQC